MRRLLRALFPFSLSLFFCGCVSVTTFSESPQEGGELEVSAFFADVNGPEANEKLAVIMRSNCAPNAYKIIKKGKVKTGETTMADGNETTSAKTTISKKDAFGSRTYDPGTRKSTSSSSTTSDVYAWRVTYKCLKAAN